MQGAVLVTGASRGIGAATARAIATAGYPVVVNYARQAEAAAGLVSDIEKSGGKAVAVQADVAREEDVLRMFASIDDRFGSLVGLVNNAGIIRPQMRLDAMTSERFAQIMAVNVIGTLLCAREAVKRMSTAHGGAGGSIVNLSSVAARLGAPGEYVDYAASKGAIDTFTIGLAREVAAEGIRVNAVRPGIIQTDIHASGGDPGRVARIGPTVPMGREGQPDEIAAAVLWLLSDAASYVSGTILDVTGGR
jgi:NAD(P)-dependent dehydrogenase (short-subunit alcohol dehydrogenase family)